MTHAAVRATLRAVSNAASTIPAGAAPDYDFAGAPRGQWSRAARRFIRHRLATISLVVLAAMIMLAFLGPRLAPYPYNEPNIEALSQSPSSEHPFGTTQEGGDYFSSVLYGLGTEMRIALIVGFFGTLIGTVVGVACGYFGGILDNLLMRLTDLMLTLPPLIALLVGATYLHTTTNAKVAILLATLLWMPVARVVRGTSLSLSQREFVDAARAVGATDTRIIVRHVLPNSVGPLAVAASLMTVTAVLLETTLAYLGFGFAAYNRQYQRPSLGDLMSVANAEGLFHWWGIAFPGLAVVALVMPIYFVGEGIRDALDPNERRYLRPLRRRRRHRRLSSS